MISQGWGEGLRGWDKRFAEELRGKKVKDSNPFWGGGREGVSH